MTYSPEIAMRFLLAAFAFTFATPAFAQDALITQAARQVLSGLQAQSFRDDREYCGTIGVDRAGRVLATRPRRGGQNGCSPRRGRSMVDVLASYHTHGAFSPNADSEIPSPGDVRADRRQGVDGYIATPGGRLWFVDGAGARVQLICGPGYLPSDPWFVRGGFGVVAPAYTLTELGARARVSRR